MEEKVREREKNIRVALLLRTVLENGVATTLDIAKVFEKERGMRKKAALNMAHKLAEELVGCGILERVGEGKPFRYKLTPQGAVLIYEHVWGSATIDEDLILDYVLRQAPQLSLYITGYRKLRQLKQAKRTEKEEKIYSLLKWFCESELFKKEQKRWEDLLHTILQPIAENLLERGFDIPDNPPFDVRETIKEIVKIAEKNVEAIREDLKVKEERLAKAKSIVSRWG